MASMNRDLPEKIVRLCLDKAAEAPQWLPQDMLGLVFLRFVCASGEASGEAAGKAPLRPGRGGRAGAEESPEPRKGPFLVPDSARWDTIFPPGIIPAETGSPETGREDPAAPREGPPNSAPDPSRAVAGAIRIIEGENPLLRNLFPETLSRPPSRRAPARDIPFFWELGGLLGKLSAGETGRVFTGLLGEFEKALPWSRRTRKDPGPFFPALPEAPVPPRVAALLALMLEPYQGRFFDPCCGSAGISAGAADFISARRGKLAELAFYGQERRAETWRLARMNLMVRGVDTGGILWNPGGPLLRDPQGDIKFDFIAACPPAEGDPYSWIRYTLDRLSPAGLGALVLPRSSLHSPRSDEREIRRSLVEGRLLDCVVNLPPRIFSSHSLGPCVWFFSRAKISRGRRGDEALFIDARNLGRPLNRRDWEFSPGDISRIARTYHNWRFPKAVPYRDVRAFAVSVLIPRIREAAYCLNPAHYLGIGEEEEEEPGRGLHFAALRAEFEALVKEEGRLNRRTLESLRKIREEDLR
ncbi:MAG: N-6 DNA methylase [Treponema sp.]|jgi:type I restriction enzyme M protein|nr:N-6 DNA methylase [Treponema sp.]